MLRIPWKIQKPMLHQHKIHVAENAPGDSQGNNNVVVRSIMSIQQRLTTCVFHLRECSKVTGAPVAYRSNCEKCVTGVTKAFTELFKKGSRSPESCLGMWIRRFGPVAKPPVPREQVLKGKLENASNALNSVPRSVPSPFSSTPVWSTGPDLTVQQPFPLPTGRHAMPKAPTRLPIPPVYAPRYAAPW